MVQALQRWRATWRKTVAARTPPRGSISAMEHNDHLVALARDGAAFAEACDAAGLAAAVDSCPDWSVADLVWHLTEVHQFWRTIVGERRSTWEGLERPARPSDKVLLDEYRSGFNDTLSVLGAVDPEQSNWTWSSADTSLTPF